MSILLNEGRKEDLKKRYTDKFKDYPDNLDFVFGISDLQDFNHKYTDFVLKNINPNSSADEIEEVVELIKDFDKFSSQFPKKDINQYNSLKELKMVVGWARIKQKEKDLENAADKIYEDDKFLVVKPKTEEASCKYGANTKWCVTSKGSGHFGRYTAGRQGLYFIINKAKSTNKNYSKVAIHFDDGGQERYWDTQDSPMSQREIDVFEYAFPEMIETIKNDYKQFAGSMIDKFLIETFDKVGETSREVQNYLKSKFTLSTYVRGFQNMADSGFGYSEGILLISLISNEENITIDEYEIFVKYKSKGDKQFVSYIGFTGPDSMASDENYIDLGLEDWGFDAIGNLDRTPSETAESVRNHIAGRVLDHIANNPKLTKKVAGTSSVWRPDRFNYGYTFGKNKGLIKKLVDYLDSGAIGTKLEFLETIGKLKTKIVNGKKLYSHSQYDNYFPSSQFRGQFSSFFASAKLAGILAYRKIGKEYFLVKGPNFEAFKSGKLKAL